MSEEPTGPTCHSCALPRTPNRGGQSETWGPAALPHLIFHWSCPSPPVPSFLKAKISTELKVNCGQLGREGMETYSPTRKNVCLPLGREDIPTDHFLLRPSSGRNSSPRPHPARQRRMVLGVRRHFSNPFSKATCSWRSFWVPWGKPLRALGSPRASLTPAPSCVTLCLYSLMALYPRVFLQEGIMSSSFLCPSVPLTSQAFILCPVLG